MENGDMMMTAQVEWKSNGCVSDLYVRWLGGSRVGGGVAVERYNHSVLHKHPSKHPISQEQEN